MASPATKGAATISSATSTWKTTAYGFHTTDGVWFQPCHFNVTSGGFSVVLKGIPGSKIGTH